MADKEQSIQALMTLLEKVPEIKKVSRQFKSFSEIPKTQFPYIVLEEDIQGEISVEYTSGGFVNVTFIVNVIGYESSSKDLATKINNLDKLVTGTLGTDFTSSDPDNSIMRTAGLNGFTIDPLSEKTGGELNPYGSFTRPIRLEFQGQVSEGW